MKKIQAQLDENKDFIFSISSMSYDKILYELAGKGILISKEALKRWFDINGGKPKA